LADFLKEIASQLQQLEILEDDEKVFQSAIKSALLTEEFGQKEDFIDTKITRENHEFQRLPSQNTILMKPSAFKPLQNSKSYYVDEVESDDDNIHLKPVYDVPNQNNQVDHSKYSARSIRENLISRQESFKIEKNNYDDDEILAKKFQEEEDKAYQEFLANNTNSNNYLIQSNITIQESVTSEMPSSSAKSTTSRTIQKQPSSQSPKKVQVNVRIETDL
jgi:hypothetical protein